MYTWATLAKYYDPPDMYTWATLPNITIPLTWATMYTWATLANIFNNKIMWDEECNQYHQFR